MKITTVLAAFASSSLIATGALAQSMQPIPNPPETEHPAHHATHHHVTHHAHHATNRERAEGRRRPQRASGRTSIRSEFA